MSAELALIALIAGPLCAAIVSMLSPRVAYGVCTAAGVLQVIAVVALTYHVLDAGPLRYSLGGWSRPLGIELYVDGLSALMLTLSNTVSCFLMLYAKAYFGTTRAGVDDPSRHFWPTFILAWVSMNALFVSGDLFNLYVTLELLTLTAVGLVGLSGSAMALIAALKYLFVALAGSLFYLLGVALIYSNYGTVDWALLSKSISLDPATGAAIAMMTVALAMKMALFPLHFWLPGAHSIAPAPVSALLSAVMLKAPFYIMARIWFFLMPESEGVFTVPVFLGVLGVCAVLWGSIQSLSQTRAKLMLAYSSVAQVGYICLVFALFQGAASEAAWNGAAYVAWSHALAKAAAFLAVGTLAVVLGTDNITAWRGVASREPVVVLAFALAGVSLMGLPPSGGFIGKWLLLTTAIEHGHFVIAAALVIGGFLSAAYVFKVIGVSMQSEGLQESPPVSLPAAMRWVPLVLAILVVLLGLVPFFISKLLRSGAPFGITA